MASSPLRFVLLLLAVIPALAYRVDVEVETAPLRGTCEGRRVDACYDDIHRGGSPSRMCCEELERVPRDCICDVLTRDSRLDKSQYRERAMRLPEECGLPQVTARECQRHRASDVLIEVTEGHRRGSEDMSLRSCYGVVERGTRPSRECCQELERIPEHRMCEALRQERRFEGHRDRAMRLPEQCGLSRPEGRECRRSEWGRQDRMFEGGRCDEERRHLRECYADVERGSRPSEQCCNALDSISKECRCEVVREDPHLGESRFQERAMRFFGQCEVSTPRECRRHHRERDMA